jgi:hypothetical protein
MNASNLLLNAYVHDDIALGGEEQHLVGLINRMRHRSRDIGHMLITMAAARADGEDESEITRVNLLMARNADRRGKTARTQCLTERRAHAIAGVGEDRPEANAGSFRNWTNRAGPGQPSG